MAKNMNKKIADAIRTNNRRARAIACGLSEVLTDTFNARTVKPKGNVQAIYNSDKVVILWQGGEKLSTMGEQITITANRDHTVTLRHSPAPDSGTGYRLDTTGPNAMALNYIINTLDAHISRGNTIVVDVKDLDTEQAIAKVLAAISRDVFVTDSQIGEEIKEMLDNICAITPKDGAPEAGLK